MLEMIGIMGTSMFVYFFYHFLREQYTLMYNSTSEESANKEESITAVVKEIKYEDKYLDKFNDFENTFSFQEEDLQKKTEKLKEIIEKFNAENKDAYECDANKLDELTQAADEYMVQHFLSRLKNAYVIENTPIGNVAMRYNHEKGAFEYYSDKNIPYRFLETVSRKYVTTFYCKPLYIIMDSELEIAKQKWKEEKEKEKEEANNRSKIVKTKDIFSNFKSIRPIQINNVSNKSNIRQMHNPVTKKLPTNESQILKENANRYTHLGKFSNFMLLQIPDKSNYDKNLKLSYRDYLMMKK